jgi:hypothetical protein
MVTWILIAAIGGVFSIIGILILIQRYLRGEISQLYLFAIIVGYISFVSFALISSLRSEFASGLISVIILLPAFVALVFLIHQNQKSKKLSK